MAGNSNIGTIYHRIGYEQRNGELVPTIAVFNGCACDTSRDQNDNASLAPNADMQMYSERQTPIVFPPCLDRRRALDLLSSIFGCGD